jgi:DNA-binding helix-hairpin-helix protein with protein kinase domain
MARAALRKKARTAPLAAVAAPPGLLGTLRGDVYQLGPEVGSGGEGIIRAVARRPELLAKLYRHAPQPHDVDKLRALVRAATPDLLTVTAWPTDCLKDRKGTVVGFVMPRVTDARPLYELYSPRSRVHHYPYADFRFLLHAASNVARLFAAVEQAGFLMGDVNHGNILVRGNGTVAAVDCDSFQVGDGSPYPCRVGTELFLPPELIGQNLGAVTRTPTHTAFGMAVLLFHLLFMGRHPFAGRFHGAGEMPIERAIGESRFAYAQATGRTQMSPPPFTPPLAVAGPETAELFERAFHPNGHRGSRPAPEAWVKALDAAKGALTVCSTVPWHQHASNLGSCPWCAIERGSGAKLFGGLIRAAPTVLGDIESVWSRYLAIADPGPPQPLPREKDWVPPPTVRRELAARRVAATATGLGVAFAGLCAPASPMAAAAFMMVMTTVVLVIGLRTWLLQARRAQALGVLVQAEQAWLAVAQDWQVKAQAPDLKGEHRASEDLKARINALAPERETRLRALARPVAEAEQRARYLGQFRIEDARLYNLGPARCAVLRSWGVDTAADVTPAKVAEIPGFGRNLTDRIVSWADGLQRQFRFEAGSTVDPLEVQKLDRELAGRRIKLMKELRIAIGALEQRINAFQAGRAADRMNLESAFNAWMLARHAMTMCAGAVSSS